MWAERSENTDIVMTIIFAGTKIKLDIAKAKMSFPLLLLAYFLGEGEA